MTYNRQLFEGLALSHPSIEFRADGEGVATLNLLEVIFKKIMID